MPYLSPVLEFAGQTGTAAAASSSSLSFSSDMPPRSSHILVTDEVATEGTWALVHFLQVALRARPPLASTRRADEVAGTTSSRSGQLNRGNLIWVGCDGKGEQHCLQVAKKAGINIKISASSHFRYIDASNLASSSSAGHEGWLSNLLKEIKAALSELSSSPATWRQDDAAETVVIIDDLSTLTWCMDVANDGEKGAQEMAVWLKTLRRACTEHNAALVTLIHASSTSLSSQFRPEAGPLGGTCDMLDERLLRKTLRMADLWIELRQLRSGRARDCTGELVLHPLTRPRVARLVNEHAPKHGPPGPPSSSASESSTAVPLSSLDIRTSAEGSANALLYHIFPDGSRGASAAYGTPRSFSSSTHRHAAASGVSSGSGSGEQATGGENNASSIGNGTTATLSRAAALALKDADAALASADKAVRIWERRSGLLVH